MVRRHVALSMQPDSAALLARLEACLPAMRARAPALDETAQFPAEDIAGLAAAGLLSAPLPRSLGGLGLGTEPHGAETALAAFRTLGRGHMAIGRLFEAHVNAVRLAVRFGQLPLQHSVADDAKAGHMLGLWVTDPPCGGLQAGEDGTLDGAKRFCSGAGHIHRAVVTATNRMGQARLAYVRLDQGVATRALPASLAGMRAATTGEAVFTRAPGAMFGAPGDYLREPDFSCGAWRTVAVTLGGLDALVEQLRLQLVARGRSGDPHQQARFGRALIAAEGARLWTEAAAARAEAASAGQDAVAYVGLARLAVERACLDVIETAQRSLGIAAVQRSNPAERLCRDLGTYLRQPAADNVLAEAAAAALHAGEAP